MVTQVTVNKAPASPQPPFQGQRSFVQRLIEVTVKLSPNPQNNQPKAFDDGSDTVTLSKSRTSVRIEKNGAPAGSLARVSIYGLTPSLMNQLQTLGQNFNEISRNTILIKAGDAINGLSTVFAGTIANAYGNYNAAPNVAMILECQSGLIDAVVPTDASSFTGPTDVATIMAGFAKLLNGGAGIGFENNGITTKLSSPYFRGNVRDQIQQCAEDAHINAEIVDNNTKLAIWPIGGSRTSLSGIGPIPLISKETGMIGYPTFFLQNGVIVRMMFNPQIAFGGTIRVQSILPAANKTYVVYKLNQALDSLVPNGQWMSTAACFALGFAAPPLTPLG